MRTMRSTTILPLIAVLVCSVLQMYSCKDSGDSSEGSNALVDSLLISGDLHMDSAKYDLAIAAFQQATSQELTVSDKAVSLFNIGYCYDKLQNFPQAIGHYKKAEVLFGQMQDSILEMQADLNLGVCFKMIGMYDSAMLYTDQGEQVAQRMGYAEDLEMAYNQFGVIHYEIGNYQVALEYHNKALEACESQKDPPISIGPSVNNIGNCHFALGQYDSAEQYYTNYKKIAEAEGKPRKVARAMANLGKTYLKAGQTRRFDIVLDSAFALYNKINYLPGVVFARLLRAERMLPVNADSTIHEAKLALALAQELQLTGDQLEAHKILAQAYEDQGELQKALEYYNQYETLKEEVEGKEELSKIHTYELFTRSDKLSREIEKESNMKERRVIERNFALIATLVLILLLYIIFNRYTERKRFVEEYFSSESSIILKKGRKIRFTDIMRVESDHNHLILYTNTGEIVEKNTTLKEFAERLPKIMFGRPQRGIILNFEEVSQVIKTKLVFRDKEINISPKYREKFIEQWEHFLKV